MHLSPMTFWLPGELKYRCVNAGESPSGKSKQRQHGGQRADHASFAQCAAVHAQAMRKPANDIHDAQAP